MTSFFKRAVKNLLTKDATPASLLISREDGSVTFSRCEVQRYSLLHAMLDSDADGLIGGAEGASFLRRSGLDDVSLSAVWRLASGGTSKAKLTLDDFLIACKLVSLSQMRAGVELSMLPLLANEALGLADFHYDIIPDASLGGAAAGETELPRASISVSVGNPTKFGTGFVDKHTRYCVTTMTSLSLFPRKDMAVWR